MKYFPIQYKAILSAGVLGKKSVVYFVHAKKRKIKRFEFEFEDEYKAEDWSMALNQLVYDGIICQSTYHSTGSYLECMDAHINIALEDNTFTQNEFRNECEPILLLCRKSFRTVHRGSISEFLETHTLLVHSTDQTIEGHTIESSHGGDYINLTQYILKGTCNNTRLIIIVPNTPGLKIFRLRPVKARNSLLALFTS